MVVLMWIDEGYGGRGGFYHEMMIMVSDVDVVVIEVSLSDERRGKVHPQIAAEVEGSFIVGVNVKFCGWCAFNDSDVLRGSLCE